MQVIQIDRISTIVLPHTPWKIYKAETLP